jgi:hypothetical protein
VPTVFGLKAFCRVRRAAPFIFIRVIRAIRGKLLFWRLADNLYGNGLIHALGGIIIESFYR